MHGNINGFSSVGQVELARNVKFPDGCSPIKLNNNKHTYLVKNQNTVCYIEECDVFLNPSHHTGQGEKIAHFKVISTISLRNGEIQHTCNEAFITPYPEKLQQCIDTFGDTRSLISRLISKLKEQLHKLARIFFHLDSDQRRRDAHTYMLNMSMAI